MNSLTDNIPNPGAATENELTTGSLDDSSTRIDTEPTAKTRLHKSAGLRQLIKFCLVGVSSTVVDKGMYWVLQTTFPAVFWWIFTTISFCFGVSNGFFWNRLWTFRAHGEGHSMPRQQYARFFASNTIGLMLNLVFTKMFLVAFTGKILHDVNPPPSQVVLSSLCAAPIVVIWNFTVAKYWTFRQTPVEGEAVDPPLPNLTDNGASEVKSGSRL